MCRNGENEELRYSIRSVMHFFPNAEIWLIGGKPSWYTGNYIKVTQGSSKYLNVKNGITALLQNKNIKNTFIYMNDDFYLTAKPNFSKTYHRGTIEKYLNDSLSCCSKYVYVKLMNRTYNKIKKIVKENVLNYELHIPIKISKDLLEKSYSRVDLWRSFYGNVNKLGGIEIEDCKVYPHHISDNLDLNRFIKDHSPFLSSNDNTFEFLQKNYLSEKFPNKTIYEAD